MEGGAQVSKPGDEFWLESHAGTEVKDQDEILIVGEGDILAVWVNLERV